MGNQLSLARTAKVLLIGGRGFIGRNLASELSAHGHQVILAAPSAQCEGASISQVQLELRNLKAVEALLDAEKPNAVIHLASRLIPSSGHDDFLTERKEVVEPTVNLLPLLAARAISFTFFSSGGAIYGASARAREEDPCQPISLYGIAKREIETAIHQAHEAYGLQYLIVRPANPYGPHQSLHGQQGLISVLFGKAIAKESLHVWGDGSVVRDYLYIDDLAFSIRQLLESQVQNVTLNIGSGVGHSLTEVVKITEQILGTKIELVFESSRSVDVRRIVLDVTKLKDLGAWRSRSLHDGIKLYARKLGLVG